MAEIVKESKFVSFRKEDPTLYRKSWYTVLNTRDGRYLGTIEWDPEWKQYILLPFSSAKWSDAYLSEVIDFLRGVNDGITQEQRRKQMQMPAYNRPGGRNHQSRAGQRR